MLEIDSDGWLHPVQRLPSPNCDDRPHGEVSLLVIHGISLPPGCFGGDAVVRLFLNQLDPAAHPAFAELAGLRVSAHLFIDRGGRMIQFVPFGRRAWHAGRSRYAGRPNCNDFAVGIELEGTDTSGYEEAQMRALATAARALLARYPALTAQRIRGHCDIAPGRKTDPGPGFDWSRLRTLLEETP
ncbi:MAG: 1,6-anhydro-N-acetylmuramyl-L-alanine amidase AmpD [Pseudomonadota bacterium]